jgi:outer membrane lipoprotein SlyB
LTPLAKCQSALSTCQTLVDAQDAQITLLKAEVADYRKRVDAGIKDTPITLYTALGGALAGGTIGLVREGGQQGLLQAITGAGVGAIVGAVLEELVK